MACRVTMAAALCALLGACGPAASNPIESCVTSLSGYEGDLIAVVDGQTVLTIDRFSEISVIGNAADSAGGDQPPIWDVESVIGKLVVGGALTEIDGVPFAGIAAWGGSSWSPLGAGMNGAVAALAAFRGRLIAGGEFTEAGGIRARHVARWDGTKWWPLGPGLPGTVRRLAVWDNMLIAAVVADDSAGLYAWDGRLWSSIESSAPCQAEDGQVSTLATYGRWLVAGKSCPGCDAVPICAWDGTSWLTVGDLLGTGGSPPDRGGALDMTVYDGTLVVGGAFSDPGHNLARWDGAHWSAVGSGTDGPVCALTVIGGRLYSGGLFTSADGESADCLAAWEDSVKTPQSLQISMYENAAYLYWITPPDAGFRSTIVRYATDGFPADPSQGAPVPNGADGVFVRPPSAFDGFFHGSLTRGLTYYYSAFAAYADSVYSRPATLFVTMDDYDPPYHLWRFEADPGDSAVTLSWQNPYDSDLRDALIRYDTGGYPLCPTEGCPVPNGHEGRFEGTQMSDSTFVHRGLANGVEYYYSAFAFDSSGNYSDPVSASATPRAMVRDFEAVAESLAVGLIWRNPPDSSLKETFICFGFSGYPDGPGRGTPLPNGNGGRFAGSPGGRGEFRHQNLTAGRTYYYSAFACDSALNYSEPVQACARVRYVAPPTLALWIDRSANTGQNVELHPGADAFLDPASIEIRIGADRISEAPANPGVWLWNPQLTGTGDSLSIVVSASDIDGNTNCKRFTTSVGLVPKGEAGYSQSADRRVRLEFEPRAVSQDTYVAILSCWPIFESDPWVKLAAAGELTWSYIITPQDDIAEQSAWIIFDYRGSDLDSLGAPGALRIRHEDIGAIRSYTDPVAKIVSAQISRLGMFTLEMGSSYPDPFVDVDVLAVELPCPNPFEEGTNLRFQIRASQRVKIAVYDAIGRRVVRLADVGMRPGFHGVTWDGRDERGDLSPSGVYFVRIENGVKSSTSKVVLVR